MMIRAAVLLWVVICMDQSQRITPMNSPHTDASDCLVNQNLLTPAQMRRAGRSNLFLYAEDSAHSTSAMKYVKMSSNVEFLTQPSAASIPNGSIKLMVGRCRIPVNQDSDSGSEVYRLVFSSRIGSTRHPGNFLVLWSLPSKTSESEVASHTNEDTTAASNYVVSLHKLLTVGLNEHHIEIPAGALLAPFRLNLMVEVNQLSEESYEQMTLYLERVQSPVVTRGVEDDWSDLLPSTSPPFLDQRLIDAGTLVSVSNQQNLLLEPTTILPLPGALSSDPQAQRHHEKEEEEEEEDERILGPWEVATDSEVSGFLTNRTTFWSPAKSTQTLRVRAIHVALTTTRRRSVVCLCVVVLPSSTSGTSLVRRCSWVVEVDQKPPGTEGVPQSRRVTRVLSFEFGDVASRMLSAFLKLSVSMEGNRWKKSPVRRLGREVPLNESALVHIFQVHGRMEEGASPVDTTEPIYEDVDVIAAHPHLQRTDTTRVSTKGKTRERVPIAPPPLPPLPPPLLPPQTPPAPLPMDPEPEPEPHKQFEVEWSSPPLPRFSPYRDDSGGYKPRTLTPPYIPTPPAMDARMKLITGLVVGLVLPTVLIAIACYWCRTRARRKRTAAERRAAAANWWNSPEEGEQHIRLNNPAFENPSPITSTENPPAVENDPTSYLDFL